MGFAKGDHLPRELSQIPFAFALETLSQPIPVVLAVGVVVSVLGIACLVPRQQHGNPLSEQNRRDGVLRLLHADFANPTIGRLSLVSIITAVVDRIAVPVILPVFQIVLLPIAEGIHQCKSAAVRGIIDKAVPLTLPAHLVGELHHAALHMVLHSAQSVQEIIVADEQVLSSALALQQLSRKMIVKNLGILQIGVGRDPLDGRVAANQPEAVHPVLPHPPDQRVHHQILTCALHKGHLHDTFHPLGCGWRPRSPSYDMPPLLPPK